MPLPLGGEHGLPYSRGLMARALMAVGVAPDRAYSLARRAGDDLAARHSEVIELERLDLAEHLDRERLEALELDQDRKSTRLNSSH